MGWVDITEIVRANPPTKKRCNKSMNTGVVGRRRDSLPTKTFPHQRPSCYAGWEDGWSRSRS